ncbi:SUKH-3 immunity protein [Lishizhenia tianjinensis]|uniref:SUKH-3 immunity protein n=1 Tax=Lishizhenia tianjinensis TaxID=477690 RepID=A0A1I6XKP6_9FLAO|nr:SUKH-3 domain-containing protein [Lishizhenia tianjinensis]SFT38683.1 SUKH-3 immunity protein [Lishizhenia tianjinensis]
MNTNPLNTEDKDKLFGFLNGDLSTEALEQWLYYTPDLEERLGKEFYFELIDTNYRNKQVRHELKKIVFQNYITTDDFNEWKLHALLKKSGWFKDRNLEISNSTFPSTQAFENALSIINEFGRLKFNSNETHEEWTPTLLEFLTEPYEKNTDEFETNISLVCFAYTHNAHVYLYVDDNNNYYTDNIAGDFLYKYTGPTFDQLLKEILQIVDEDNFEKFATSKKITQEKAIRNKPTALHSSPTKSFLTRLWNWMKD